MFAPLWFGLNGASKHRSIVEVPSHERLCLFGEGKAVKGLHGTDQHAEFELRLPVRNESLEHPDNPSDST